jgi:hypothetical protein
LFTSSFFVRPGSRNTASKFHTAILGSPPSIQTMVPDTYFFHPEEPDLYPLSDFSNIEPGWVALLACNTFIGIYPSPCLLVRISTCATHAERAQIIRSLQIMLLDEYALGIFDLRL